MMQFFFIYIYLVSGLKMRYLIDAKAIDIIKYALTNADHSSIDFEAFSIDDASSSSKPSMEVVVAKDKIELVQFQEKLK